ncbi:tyrosine-type recombinase/integrase [Stutzerimonas stutzeri]|uniref:Site-specific integrase n=1 Tax=Stutzerimonas stutzeri TaxID=316 RepID=A0AA42PCM6_STUST|nr:site-specific integrase [Stutzerimonas stutzeri]MDH1236659.1 site-specific integrase [Stutzerimonas stutzeri]HBN9860469.1 site-specific integrase [Pseudomonas aeruginosa]HBN9885834.1 site-specific integrase [Pseudomonas aeruginosa]
MSQRPQPFFETFDRFHELNFLHLNGELPVVRDFLLGFGDGLEAAEGYRAVRGFLKSYAGNEATYNSYRTHVERLLLWSLLVAGKPIVELRRRDAEAFMEFCLNPPSDWIGPVVKSRFLRLGSRKKLDTDSYIINEQWRPFSHTVAKRERKIAREAVATLPSRPYRMSQGSVAQVFAVCGSFFQHAIDEGLTEVNPFRAVKQKSIYKQRNTLDVASRSLTQLQWSYVIETAEQMAVANPLHERTLFIVATLFSMYLRVSDLVGRDNWRPTMGDIRRDSMGNWWFHVVGKGNKAAKISIRDDYIQNYLVRYRRHLQLSPLPSAHEKTSLISTLKGRGGLSDRHIRLLLQEVFDSTLVRMAQEGWNNDEIDQLRSASLHWLRHTSATFDAPHRDMKDLQADLRHNSLSTTQNTYYNSLDEQRAHSVKGLKIKN